MKKNLLVTAICLAVLSLSSACFAEMYMDRGPEPLSVEETLEWLDENAPDMLKDLEAVRDLDEELYHDMVFVTSEELASGLEMQMDSPEAFKLFLNSGKKELRSELLALQYRMETDSGKRAKLKKKLEDAIKASFEARMNEHNAMIEAIEKDLTDLKRQGNARNKNRNKIIEKRLEELTTPEDESTAWW